MGGRCAARRKCAHDPHVLLALFRHDGPPCVSHDCGLRHARLLGASLLGVRGLEYADKFRANHVPWWNYQWEGAVPPGASVPTIRMFYWLYFVMTGLHAFHMIVGLGMLGFWARACSASEAWSMRTSSEPITCLGGIINGRALCRQAQVCPRSACSIGSISS